MSVTGRGKWIVVWGVVGCGILAFGLYFGPQISSYRRLRPFLDRPSNVPPRGWGAVPRPLIDQEVSTADGTTVTQYGYRFEVPWDGIVRTWDEGHWFRIRFRTGQDLTFFDPADYPDVITRQAAQDDALRFDQAFPHGVHESRFDQYKDVMSMSPARLTPFCSRREFARIWTLLTIKGLWFEHNPAVPDIFEFEVNGLRGFEISFLSQGFQEITISLFDAANRRFQISFETDRDSGIVLTQPEINRVIRSFAPAPPTDAERSARQGQASVEQLFQKLQSPLTTDQASDQLEKIAETDAPVRVYLAQHLPALIDHGPKYYQPPPNSALRYPGPVWLNLVRLAQDLAIVEATPELAKWIGVRTSALTTLTTEIELENSPAGQALIQIGDPSIPALEELLAHGTAYERWDATDALLMIGSPKAKTALQEHAAHESDESLAAYIEKALVARSK